jgi:hypothetical protein
MRSSIIFLVAFIMTTLFTACVKPDQPDDPVKPSLTVSLPVMYRIAKGDEVVIGVAAPQAGVTYSWSPGTTCQAADCSKVRVKPEAAAVYVVTATRGTETAKAATVVAPQ